MSDYTDAAPNVSKLKSEAEFKLDFPAPPEPSPPPPEPNAVKKAALYAAFVAEYNANGGAVALKRLAKSQGVPLRWCKILAAEVAAAKGAVYAVEPE